MKIDEVVLNNGVKVGEVITDMQKDFIWDCKQYIENLDNYRKEFVHGIDCLDKSKNALNFKKFYRNEIKMIDKVSENIMSNSKFALQTIPDDKELSSCRKNRECVKRYLDSLLSIIKSEIS